MRKIESGNAFVHENSDRTRQAYATFSFKSYKWMFKTACAILILSNTFNIVMAVFDVSQSVIAQAGGLIQVGTVTILPPRSTRLCAALSALSAAMACSALLS